MSSYPDETPAHGTTYSLPKTQAASTSPSSLLFSGWITKKGRKRKNWKRRWACLSNDGMILSYMSKRAVPQTVKGKFNIDDLTKVEVIDEGSNHFLVTSSERVMHVKTANYFEMILWVDTINAAVEMGKLDELVTKLALLQRESKKMKDNIRNTSHTFTEGDIYILETRLTNIAHQLDTIMDMSKIEREDVETAEQIVDEKCLLVSDPASWWWKYHEHAPKEN